MSGFLRALAQDTEANARAVEDINKPVRFVASTEGLKRDGKNLQAEDWELGRYHDHPIVLWAHDLWGERLPIGLAEVSFDERNLLADIYYDQDDEFAMQVRGKALKGMVGASVNWDEIEAGERTVNELLEISNVPVPLDPASLAVRSEAALELRRSLAADLLDNLKALGVEGDPPAEVDWEEIAGRMARLFSPGTDDSEERQQEYRALLPHYRRADKQPPELVDVSALTPELVRGLFLAGEPDMFPDLFTQAVPGRHLAALEAAHVKLGEVIAEVKAGEPPITEEPDAIETRLQELLDKLPEANEDE